MRANAAKDIDAAAWVVPAQPRVQIRIGWQRYSATPDEATDFAHKLLAAANELRKADRDAQ